MWSIFLTIFFTGKNSNLSNKLHKDLAGALIKTKTGDRSNSGYIKKSRGSVNSSKEFEKGMFTNPNSISLDSSLK